MRDDPAERKAASRRANIHLYGWSALCRLWNSVEFARGTSHEQNAVNAFKAVEQLLDGVEAEALSSFHPLTRPPVGDQPEGKMRAEIMQEGWPSERPELPRDK